MNHPQDPPQDAIKRALQFIESARYRAEIHQAAGITAVQLGISLEESMLRMKAHAFAHDATLFSVAVSIVNHELFLTDDRSTP